MTQPNKRPAKTVKTDAALAVGDWIARPLKVSAPAVLDHMLKGRLQYGSIRLRLPNGQSRFYRGPSKGPDAEIDVHAWRLISRLALGGSLGFAQSYIDGDWDSPDPSSIVELASLNRAGMSEPLRGRRFIRWLNWLTHRLRDNTLRGSRRNIAYHYDLGNEFYRSWLDDTMTYSAAMFDCRGNSLEAAQKCKYRKLLDRMGVRPGDHILEIGSGWGGFAEIAAGERGAKVTGLTLSREQYDFACERIQKAGLGERVRFELRDYREENGRYDGVASIEMFEAVGERYWPAFFSKLREALKPGGRAGLQIITIDEALFPAYRKSADFIQTYIFPGGMLPSFTTLKADIGRAGLTLCEASPFALDYARTLRLWRERFDAAFDAGRLPAQFDETFRRLWDYYLSYCEGGFRGGSINVFQLAISR